LPDAWVQVSRAIAFDPGAPTALIVGSALEFEGEGRRLAARQDLTALCEGLASSLSRLGFNLVNGACPGLPDDVMKVYSSASRSGASVGLSAYPSPIDHKAGKAFAPDGFPLNADITVFCGTGFELLNVLNTLCADILVVVGGGIGTLLEVASAAEQELPVICLGPSGGMASEVEAILRRYIAEFKHFGVSTVETVDGIEAELAAFVERFRGRGGRSRMAPLVSELAEHTHALDQGVTIRVADDTQSISYQSHAAAVTLHAPLLMTDRVRLARIPGRGEVLLHALDEAPRTYIADGVALTLSPRQQRILWGPSIDTLLLLRCVKDRPVQAAPRALEVGAGCGFLALWLAGTGRAQTALGIDTDKVAVLSALWNAERLGLKERCTFSNLAFDQMEPERFDLVLCNPPYLPVPEASTREPHTYAGTGLLASFLDRSDAFLAPDGAAYVILSSASYVDRTIHARIECLEAAGRATCLSTIEAPMKVGAVLRNKPWLSYLMQGGGVTERPDDDYRYWHRLEAWMLTP